MDDRGTSSEPLTPVQCLERLRAGGVGRIAFSQRALPAIVSVGYTVVAGAIVFELASGSAELLAMRNAVVAFQADQGAGPDAVAWSVTCVGKARPTEDPAEVIILATSHDWQGTRPGEPAYLRMEADLLQGRWWHDLPANPEVRLTPAAGPAS